MKVLGIIMEANPFHNGHQYFIDECKKSINPDIIIAITSTSFTMRGEISLLSKFDKTKVLLNHDVDIVLELPFSQAVQSADYFSSASVLNLSKINITDLAFGCETDNIELINKYVDILMLNDFKNKLTNCKSFNTSMKETYSNLLKDYLTDDEILLFNEPNVTLAVQYIKTIKENCLNISYHIIKRINSHYHDKGITSSIASATAIRSALINNLEFNNTLPGDSYQKLIDYNFSKMKLIDLIKFKYQLNDNIENIFANSEGINNYIKNNANYDSLESFQNSLKNKRYSINRINRQVLYTLLSLETLPSYSPYVRILGINTNGLKFIGTLPKENKELIFSGIKELKNQSLNVNKTNEIELKATKLYSLLTNNIGLNKEESKLPIRKE